MAIGGSFWTEELLLKTNLQIFFRTYEAEAICFFGHNKKSNPVFYVHEGVYVLHVCIEVVV